MPAGNRSKYTLNLQAIADQQTKSEQTQRKKNRLDQSELAAGRKLKRKRVLEYAPVSTGDNPPYQETLPVASRSTEPHPSSTLSQNVNGSEHQGRKAREGFVTQTLNAATVGQVAAQETPQNQQGTDEVAQVEDADYEHQRLPAADAADATDGPQVYDEDTDMRADSSSDESEAGEGNEMDDEAFAKLFKEFYKRRPTKGMKDALFRTLEELSTDTECQRSAKTKKHKARGPKSKPAWVQEDDYLCTDGPRQRDERRVALSGYIRVVIDELLKVTDKGRLPPGPPPEVAAPTAAAFYFRWNESEKSEFNAVAARIVAHRVIRDWPSLSDVDEVFDMATDHFKYLRACYRRQTVPEVAAKEPQRHHAANANTRKHTLYRHRLQILKTIPALAKHGRLIETLRIDGTSSDEESPRSGVYTVRRKKQLSSKVQHLKRQLDQAYAIHFKGPGSKGNQLRQRIDTGLVSTRRFKIPGLPLSCLDQGWLATLTDIQKDMLEADHSIEYDFSFPVELLATPE